MLRGIHKESCRCCICQHKRGEFKFSKEHRRKIGEATSKAKLGSNPKYPNGNPNTFRALSQKVWEEHYKVKIPIDKRTGRSMKIHHRDFNVYNIVWWNLGLLSHKVHMRIHQQYNKFQKWLKIRR